MFFWQLFECGILIAETCGKQGEQMKYPGPLHHGFGLGHWFSVFLVQGRDSEYIHVGGMDVGLQIGIWFSDYPEVRTRKKPSKEPNLGSDSLTGTGP